MNNIVLVICFFYCLAMSILAINSSRNIFIKYISFFLSVVFLISLFVLNLNLLGKPKPKDLELYKVLEVMEKEDAEILSHLIYNEQSIYLLVKSENDHPIYYVLDWEEERAAELRKRMEEAAESNSTVMLQGANNGDFNKGEFFSKAPLRNPIKNNN